jgi:hypothetical protein
VSVKKPIALAGNLVLASRHGVVCKNATLPSSSNSTSNCKSSFYSVVQLQLDIQGHGGYCEKPRHHRVWVVWVVHGTTGHIKGM